MKKRDNMLVSARTPRSARSRADKAVNVMSGSAAIVASNQARSGFTFDGRCRGQALSE